MISLPIANGYRDAPKIPAFATEKNERKAAAVITIPPKLPPKIRAASETGVKLPASCSAGRTPTMTTVPIP